MHSQECRNPIFFKRMNCKHSAEKNSNVRDFFQFMDKLDRLYALKIGTFLE